ncbi:MAG: sulfite dehydrogenase [Bryobacterales bacterium]
MDHSSRRSFLSITAALTGALGACSKTEDTAQNAEAPSRLGKPVSGYGERSAHETSKRGFRESKTPEASSSRTPLEDLYGSITPSALHFERHHSGVPDLDPATHELFIHGLVERPLALSMDDIKRLPSVSKVYFVECSGNSGGEWGAKRAPTASAGHGLASCSEWTGVPLKTVLAEAGLKPEGKWLLAEGADACRMSRSVPVEKALDDALLAYGQNGEALRPGQGYPLRLILPGWEGNTNVKWLHRLEVGDQPFMTKDETSKYTDLMADGKARIFTYEMDAKSIITRPSGGQKLSGPGFYEVSGLAWSGRGRIEKVEVSTDGGATWQQAALDEPRHSKAFTRFRLPWRWDGSETQLLSRATDETGYVQPSVEDLIAARGQNSIYHNNGIKAWQVGADGAVGAQNV